MTEQMRKLKGRAVEKNVTLEYLAGKAGINRSTLQRKMKSGGKKLTVGEFAVIAAELQYTAEEVNAFIMSMKSH